MGFDISSSTQFLVLFLLFDKRKLTFSIWYDVVSKYIFVFCFFFFYGLMYIFLVPFFVRCLTIFTEFRLLQLLGSFFLWCMFVLSFPINRNALAVFFFYGNEDEIGSNDEQRVWKKEEKKLTQSNVTRINEYIYFVFADCTVC